MAVHFHVAYILKRLWTIYVSVYLSASYVVNHLVTSRVTSNNFVQIVNFVSKNKIITVVFG